MNYSVIHLLEKAQSAHNWTSFDPEKRGKQLIESYDEQLMQDLTTLVENNVAPDKIESYFSKYERLLSSWLSAKSRCASSMITGPANFNVRRNEKANRSEQKHYELWTEWRKRAITAMLRKEKEPTTYNGEIEKYEHKIISIQQSIESSKEANKLIANAKKSGEDISSILIQKYNTAPHMIDWVMKFGFSTTNLTAEVRRCRDMIEGIKKKEDQRQNNQDKDHVFEWGKLVMNYETDRIEIHHNQKPTPEVISILKRKAFKWSPKSGCWQRQITNNAIFATKEMIKQF
jgi:hypothetical protein